MPNPSVNWTARKLRLRVPSALRAPAAGYLKRYDFRCQAAEWIFEGCLDFLDGANSLKATQPVQPTVAQADIRGSDTAVLVSVMWACLGLGTRVSECALADFDHERPPQR